MRSGKLFLTSVFCYQLQQLINRLFFGDILLHTHLLLVETNLTASGTDIAIVSISHLTRAVDNATHDAYFQSYQMTRGRLDAGDGVLQVIQRAATAWTRDIFRLRKFDASGLQNSIRKLRELFN